MKNKKAILTSVLSLAFCASLVAGGTFALFTSESKTNIAISSGKVLVTATMQDLKLYSPSVIGQDGKIPEEATNVATETGFVNGGTAKLEESSIELNNMTPGDSATFNIVISNESTVMTKYYTSLWVSADTGLFAGLKVTVNENEEFKYIRQTDWQTLAVKSEDIVIPVTVELPADASNTYQNSSAELSFAVNAVQANAATDSVVIGGTNYDNLSDAMEATKEGEVISLPSGVYELDKSVQSSGSLEIQEGADVTLVLDETKIDTKVDPEVNVPTVVNKGNLTVVGGTITNKNATAGNTNVAAIHNAGGVLVLKDCVIENVAPTSGGAYAVTVDGGKVILDNCTVKGNRGAISVSNDGEVHMTGGSVTANVYYSLYLRGTGASSFENVTFTKLNNSKGKAITYNDFKDGEGSVTFTNCTFKSETAKEIPFDISSKLTGLTFNNCTFTNVKVPNA